MLETKDSKLKMRTFCGGLSNPSIAGEVISEPEGRVTEIMQNQTQI